MPALNIYIINYTLLNSSLDTVGFQHIANVVCSVIVVVVVARHCRQECWWLK